MELETINKLYLELSQVATAKTTRELKLELDLDEEKREHGDSLEIIAELRDNLESCGERANKLQSEKDKAMQECASLRMDANRLEGYKSDFDWRNHRLDEAHAFSKETGARLGDDVWIHCLDMAVKFRSERDRAMQDLAELRAKLDRLCPEGLSESETIPAGTLLHLGNAVGDEFWICRDTDDEGERRYCLVNEESSFDGEFWTRPVWGMFPSILEEMVGDSIRPGEKAKFRLVRVP